MVEYAILNAAVGLKILAARVTTFVMAIDWKVVAMVAGGLILLRLIIGGRKYRA